ncbi:MAG: aminopeptidase P family N-terminal domain-containing protein [Gemmatimonadota bacterium]
MISRRHFVGVSSLAAAGVATSCQFSENPRGGGSSVGGSGAGRPPSIAALPSRAHEVIPISVEERMGRIEKARRLMVAGGMDALMLTGGTSLVYFTNIQWGLSERLFSVVIPVNGRAFLVCPAFEEDRARE